MNKKDFKECINILKEAKDKLTVEEFAKISKKISAVKEVLFKFKKINI